MIGKQRTQIPALIRSKTTRPDGTVIESELRLTGARGVAKPFYAMRIQVGDRVAHGVLPAEEALLVEDEIVRAAAAEGASDGE